jgi:N-acetylglutamate synthase-like GNAT family acetyltransferase
MLQKLGRQDVNKAIRFLEEIFGEKDASDAKEHFRLELNDKTQHRFLTHYLVKNDNKVIAITGLYSPYKHPKSVVWLSWFAVDKNYRNEGLGSRLFDQTEKIARTSGFKNLYVVSTPGVLPFYFKRHFKRSKAEKLKEWYFPIGSIILYKRLI